MKCVPFLLAMISALLPTVAISQQFDPLKEDQEILTAYGQLVELARHGGYDGHKSQDGKLIDGLKSKQFVTSFGEPPLLTGARLANIKEVAEVIYQLQQQPMLAGRLTFDQPKITLREINGIELTAGVSAPSGVMRPDRIKWTWRLRKGLDGWRIFASFLDIDPLDGFRLRPEPILL